jgi:hypothetical protein
MQKKSHGWLCTKMNAIFLKTPYIAVLYLCGPSSPTTTPFLTNTAHNGPAHILCAQQVWEALLEAFPLKHKRMHTVLLAREIGRLMTCDGNSKNDVNHHFGKVGKIRKNFHIYGLGRAHNRRRFSVRHSGCLQIL